MTEKTITPAQPAPQTAPRTTSRPGWLWIALPIVALAALVTVFVLSNPAAVFTSAAPPVEDLVVQRITVTETGFKVEVFNNGATEVTLAQVAVDDAFWQFTAEPSTTLPRLGQATVTIPYAWVAGEPHAIVLVTNTGTTFEGEVAAATLTPAPGLREFGAYALLGTYVGIIPVALGMLWFPALRRMGRAGLNFVLALTVGLLVFLLVDTALEALEVAADVAGVFQGLPLAVFSALLAWLTILAVSGRRADAERESGSGRLRLAALIALSIGLHNLGEGLAIGAAFALGEAALGSFLVLGFTLHNVTEGIGIAAPVTRDRPSLWTFVGLCLLAGLPAVLGAWIGGFAYSPLLATVFLGIGVGAIWQVIVEVGRLLLNDAQRHNESVANWVNVSGLALGIALMYFTAYLVKF
jgi:zinc transporter ZupT